MKSILTILCFLTLGIASVAQPYQSKIRKGNDAFNKAEFDDAEVNYKKAAEENPEAFEGWFNLGDALYKQQRYDEALEAYQKGAEFAGSEKRAAATLHNMGNTFANKKEFDKASEAYKQALRLNPDDDETRYNLAKTLQELRKQEQQKNDQNQDDNKDEKDKDKNEDQKDSEKKDDPKNDQDQPQDESDENDDAKKDENQKSEEQDQEQNKDEQEGKGDEQKQDEQKPGEAGEKKMTKEEMEQILEAIANAEKKTRAKLDKKKKAKVKTSTTVKDW